MFFQEFRWTKLWVRVIHECISCTSNYNILYPSYYLVRVIHECISCTSNYNILYPSYYLVRVIHECIPCTSNYNILCWPFSIPDWKFTNWGSWVSQKFCNILRRVSLRRLYHVTEAVQAVVGSIAVVSPLTHCAMIHFVCDLKAAQMNVQRRLIREPMLHASFMSLWYDSS